MSFWKRLFGGGSKGGKKIGPAEHDGYLITPEPMAAEGGQYRLCAIVEKEVEGETKQHKLIRADTFSEFSEAANASIAGPTSSTEWTSMMIGSVPCISAASVNDGMYRSEGRAGL